MPYIAAADGTRLFYNDWGSGKPIVLIHGWPLNADMWEYNATFLAENGCRVVAYDRRGFGRSDQPWTGYGYDTLADDLSSVMEQLDLRDAMLVGFSMGGGEVARYLSRHGASRVSHAVLVSAVTPYLLKTEAHPEGADRGVFDQIVDGLKEDRPGFLATFGKKFFGAGLLNFSVGADILAWASMMALQASPKATLDCVRAYSETDFRGDMAAFTVPTMIIHGDADQTVPIGISGRKTAELIPSAEFKIYPDAPHALFYTDRAKLNADLLGFAGGGRG